MVCVVEQKELVFFVISCGGCFLFFFFFFFLFFFFFFFFVSFPLGGIDGLQSLIVFP